MQIQHQHQQQSFDQSRFIVRSWPGEFGKTRKYAIWDRQQQDLATCGRDHHAMRDMSAYEAHRWANILNVVARGGCGKCARKLSSLADSTAHQHPDYQVICSECKA
jgi:hypothetical protein